MGFHTDIVKIKDILKQNAYPDSMVNKIIKKYLDIKLR